MKVFKAAVILVVLVGITPLLIYLWTKTDNFTNRNDNPTVERSYAEYGDRDCGDFSSQSEAQKFFEDNGGPNTDYHNLDRDGDGIACESLK